MDDGRDAELDAVLIGGREQRTIVIVEYDEEWPQRYDALARRISQALAGVAFSVEHIGSTSVPGLAAKPIIDILLTVAVVEDENAYLPALEAAGFVLRVREDGHRLFRTLERDTHIHVYAAGAAAVTDYRDLRDWLRVSANDRTLYASTKKQLARQEWSDMNYYADAKTDVVREILARAREWRRFSAT